MSIKIQIKHKKSGIVKYGKYGFSWTYLFFGFFIPIYRGELGIAILHVVFSIFTLGLSNLIFAFIYNKQFMLRMLTSGWELNGSEEENSDARQALGFLIDI
ncbi:hypothetical protein HN450_03135 [bacterium]|jgi:hypothetical protein|nr:hypothetical protein [bacterium]MBT3850047.1 hypothetical protein [bacterium]MBT4435358.1 hypothetical protein [bacterium]